MRLSRQLQNAVAFGNFIYHHHVEPRDLAELIALGNRAIAAGVRE